MGQSHFYWSSPRSIQLPIKMTEFTIVPRRTILNLSATAACCTFSIRQDHRRVPPFSYDDIRRHAAASLFLSHNFAAKRPEMRDVDAAKHGSGTRRNIGGVSPPRHPPPPPPSPSHTRQHCCGIGSVGGPPREPRTTELESGRYRQTGIRDVYHPTGSVLPGSLAPTSNGRLQSSTAGRNLPALRRSMAIAHRAEIFDNRVRCGKVQRSAGGSA